MRSIMYPHVFFATFIAFLISSIGFSQTPTPTPKPREDETIYKVESRLVVIPVAVTDDKGQPVEGLAAQDFRVTEEGKNQTIDHVGAADEVPLEIALLFDVSASTDAMFKFEQDTAAKFLQEVLKPKDRATIFTVGASPVLVQPRDTAEKSIASIGR